MDNLTNDARIARQMAVTPHALSMTKFELYEEWFKQQPFYVNMRYSRGDALFLRDGDVYRELPVRIGFDAMFSNQAFNLIEKTQG